MNQVKIVTKVAFVHFHSNALQEDMVLSLACHNI